MKDFNIWFNSGLSTLPVFVSKIASDLKAMHADKSIALTVSSRTPQNTLFCNKFSDENKSGFRRFLEPDIEDDGEYLEFCLEFCKKNGITHISPYKKAEFLCKSRDRFADIGVKLVSDADNVIFGSKLESTEFFNRLSEKYPQLSIMHIPYFAFESAEEFESKFLFFKNSFSEYACDFGYSADEPAEFIVKPDIGISAKGFRHIVGHDRLHGISDIYSYRISTECTYDELLYTMKRTGSLQKSICTPFFKGDEWSIDCLKINNSVIAVPRKKDGRFTHICYPERLVGFAEKIAEHCDFQGIYNIQAYIIESDGNMKIYPLEINTRMAGGAYKSCEKTYLAGLFARKITGDDIPDDELNGYIKAHEPYTLADVETSYILENAKAYHCAYI